jgi:arylsulfatase A-like enzyme
MKKPNVILISRNSLQVDAVSALNPWSGYTPFLREFARGSTVFESAFAQVDWVVPFHMSIFTGLYSTEYGMVSKDILLIPSGVRLESPKSEYKKSQVQLVRRLI